MSALKPEAAPIILTVLMDRGAFARFDALRRSHFPPERNFLPAHITLFHHLPGPRVEKIAADLKNEARHHAPMEIRAVRLHMTGKGVSYILESAKLAALRAKLAELWAADLIPQDWQGWRPHVTIQNKVGLENAKHLHACLSANFAPFTFTAEGMTMWFYRGGPWDRIRDIRFR